MCSQACGVRGLCVEQLSIRLQFRIPIPKGSFRDLIQLDQIAAANGSGSHDRFIDHRDPISTAEQMFLCWHS